MLFLAFHSSLLYFLVQDKPDAELHRNTQSRIDRAEITTRKIRLDGSRVEEGTVGVDHSRSDCACVKYRVRVRASLSSTCECLFGICTAWNCPSHLIAKNSYVS
jgi:hypothetical protein